MNISDPFLSRAERSIWFRDQLGTSITHHSSYADQARTRQQGTVVFHLKQTSTDLDISTYPITNIPSQADWSSTVPINLRDLFSSSTSYFEVTAVSHLVLRVVDICSVSDWFKSFLKPHQVIDVMLQNFWCLSLLKLHRMFNRGRISLFRHLNTGPWGCISAVFPLQDRKLPGPFNFTLELYSETNLY